MEYLSIRLPTIIQIISKVCTNYTVRDFLLDTLLFRCKFQFQIAIFIYTNLTRQIIIFSRYAVTFRTNMSRLTRKTLLTLIIIFIDKFLNDHRHRITRVRWYLILEKNKKKIVPGAIPLILFQSEYSFKIVISSNRKSCPVLVTKRYIGVTRFLIVPLNYGGSIGHLITAVTRRT